MSPLAAKARHLQEEKEEGNYNAAPVSSDYRHHALLRHARGCLSTQTCPATAAATWAAAHN